MSTLSAVMSVYLVSYNLYLSRISVCRVHYTQFCDCYYYYYCYYYCLDGSQTGGAAQVAVLSSVGDLDTTTLLEGDIMLGLLIWLVVLSVIVISLLVFTCKQCRDQEAIRRSFFDDMRDMYNSAAPAHDADVPYRELNSSSGSLSYA